MDTLAKQRFAIKLNWFIFTLNILGLAAIGYMKTNILREPLFLGHLFLLVFFIININFFLKHINNTWDNKFWIYNILMLFLLSTNLYSIYLGNSLVWLLEIFLFLLLWFFQERLCTGLEPKKQRWMKQKIFYDKILIAIIIIALIAQTIFLDLENIFISFIPVIFLAMFLYTLVIKKFYKTSKV